MLMYEGIIAFTASLLFGVSMLLNDTRHRAESQQGIERAHVDALMLVNDEADAHVAFRAANIIAWILVCVYAYLEASQYASEGEEFDAVMSIFFLLFGVIACYSFAFKWSERDKHTFLTLTRVAFIASIVYFTFAEIPFMNDLIIYGTTLATSHLLNIFVTQTYAQYPAKIFTHGDFHASYGPITIILACTAIQSIALFAGLTLGVSAPMKQRMKAFISVPVIYALNLLRNVFVCAAYFENWFGRLFGCTPIESFNIAHDYIARTLTLLSLFIIAYAVFIFLPEALSFVDDFLNLMKPRRQQH